MAITTRTTTKDIRFFYIKLMRIVLIVILLYETSSVFAADSDRALNQCIQEKIVHVDNTVTVGEIRQACREKLGLGSKTAEDVSATTIQETRLEKRFKAEQASWDNKFLISTHKPNYILLAAVNDKTNEAPFALQFPLEDTTLDDTEVKFQISAKFPLVRELFNDSVLYFAYTNRSFWQLYNDNSAPFRETNHEPELFLTIPNDWNILGFKNSFINLGFVHQSNGRAATLSRSWNRIYANFVFEKDDWLISFKPWYRIKEGADDDDNPDIEDYMGNFELTGIYHMGKHTFIAMLRNNLDSDDNRGAGQLDWSFPLTKNLSGYVQYFRGYGESLIDYNYDQESIAVGVMLSGWN